jgi:hypothetical protein
MGAVRGLVDAMMFWFPPGPTWRALVPLLAIGWAVAFGLAAPLAIWRLPAWRGAEVRRAALLMWSALLPTVAFAAAYAACAFAREPQNLHVISVLSFFPNLAAPFLVVKSFLAVRPTARPLGFQVARTAAGLAWLGIWSLWMTTTFIACIYV